MKRLQEAGLNPNLIYGDSASGAAGQAGDIGRPFKPDFEFENPIGQLTTFQDVKLRGAQTNLVNSQNTTEAQKAILMNSQTLDNMAKMAKTKLETEQLRKAFPEQLQAMEISNKNLIKDGIRKDLDNYRISETNKNAIIESGMRVSHMVQELANKKQQGINLKATERNIDASTTLRLLEKDLKSEGIENAPYWARWIYRNFDLDGVLRPYDLSKDFKP